MANDKSVIDAQQGNPILLQTNTNTQQLTFDASTTSFLTSTNVPISGLVSPSDTIVFTEQFTDASNKNSVIVENFFQINKNSGQITVSLTPLGNQNVPVDPAAFVVANMVARDALVTLPNHLPTGAAVLVEDTGQGENAFYIWNGLSFTTISTQDSAAVDAQTLTITLNYNSPTSNILGRVSPGSEIVSVTITVVTPFNGINPILTIGDDTNGHSVIMGSNLNDLTTADKYSLIDSYLYAGLTETTIKAYLTPNGSTQGQAIISVTYV